jgi:hypothetical protein
MVFYGDFFGAKMVTVFFPKKASLIDDRSDAIRNTHKHTLFVPSCEFLM